MITAMVIKMIMMMMSIAIIICFIQSIVINLFNDFAFSIISNLPLNSAIDK